MEIDYEYDSYWLPFFAQLENIVYQIDQNEKNDPGGFEQVARLNTNVFAPQMFRRF